jgi:tetratricopeptide (TPR) repeat protein
LSDYYVATKRLPAALEILKGLRKQQATYEQATIKMAFLAAVNAQPQVAMRLVDEVIAKDRVSAPAFALKTHLLLAQRKRVEALSASEEAVRADAKSEAAHMAHAAAASAIGQLDVAKQALLEVLKLEPASVEATIELARVCLDQGLLDTAYEYAEQAVTMNPTLVEARLMRLQVMASHPEKREEAAKELAALLGQYPKSADLQYEAGLVAVGRKDNAAAYRYFTRSRELNPGFRDPLIALIKLDVETGNLAQARRRVDEAVAKDPEGIDTLLMAGTTYAMIDGTVAEKYLRKVIALDASNITAYESLAALYLTQNRLDQAREEFITLTKEQPNSIAPVTMVGILYDAQGNKAEAERWYLAALKINSRAPTAANNLAWNYIERGANLETALELAQVAHGQLPRQAEVTDTLGYAYLKKGLISQAVRTLEDAVEQDPNSALYRYHLGLAYARNEQDGKARAMLEQALKLDPKFPQAPDVHRALAGLKY